MYIYPKRLQRKAVCRICESEMSPGSGAIKVGSRWTGYCYIHLDCLPVYISERFTPYCWEWFGTHPYVPKLGRKKKHSKVMIGTRYGKSIQTEVHKEIYRLKALYRYYRKKGNEERMSELDQEITYLSYGCSPYTALQITVQCRDDGTAYTRQLLDKP